MGKGGGRAPTGERFVLWRYPMARTVLHRPPTPCRTVRHALEPAVGQGEVRLKRLGAIILCTHPILFVHGETPAVLLLEEPIEEDLGTVRHRPPGSHGPSEGFVMDVIGSGRPLAIVHHHRHAKLRTRGTERGASALRRKVTRARAKHASDRHDRQEDDAVGAGRSVEGAAWGWGWRWRGGGGTCF